VGYTSEHQKDTGFVVLPKPRTLNPKGASMQDVIEQMSEMALLFSKATNALNTLEAIKEIMAGLESEELDEEEALEEISEVLANMEALESLSDMSPEELEEMLQEAEGEIPGKSRLES
jgi:DNA integrity scanning protein DisA with diadenylate cyclase activity